MRCGQPVRAVADGVGQHIARVIAALAAGQVVELDQVPSAQMTQMQSQVPLEMGPPSRRCAKMAASKIDKACLTADASMID